MKGSHVHALPLSRRDLLTALSGIGRVGLAFAPTERDAEDPRLPLPASERVSFAVVGLGHLALEEILPAFAQSAWAKVTALVSGDRAEAEEEERRCGVEPRRLYDYRSYDPVAHDPAVQAVYIVLPNGLHAAIRG